MNDSFQMIKSAADVDLNYHAVIEASAGTGKTYTMVELVLRLMSDEKTGLPLDKILLTTFTENAANELKTRIRDELKKRLATKGLPDIIKNRFNKAVQSIESAPIYTIHGFCQRMASEFAFESGEVFDKELIDGNSVIESRFHAFLRTWLSNDTIQSAFQDYLGADERHSLSRLKSTVLQLAGQINPDFDLIYPTEPEPLPCLDNFKLMAELEELEQAYKQLLTNKDGKPNAYMKKNWSIRVQPLLQNLADNHLSNNEKYDYLKNITTQFLQKKTPFEHFFLSAPNAYIDDNWQTNKRKHPLICTQLEQAFHLLKHIQAIQQFKQAAIIKHCLDFLDDDVSQHLATHGQVTYDRIIRQLFDSLKREQETGQTSLTQAIRGKFTVAMIDEFQDTDPYQWHIFKWLFLTKDSNQHRLWVIGDPKQSIYGFRGADVSTYFQARQQMQEFGAKCYRLNTNYRTMAPLVNAFNHFFSQQQNPDSPSYWYHENSIKVEAADRQNKPELPQLIQDNSGLSVFNYIPLDGENDADSRRVELARQIAEIIKKHLIGRLQFLLKKQDKILNYDDICILVRSNQDSVIIKKACQSMHIPVSIQRSKGLYRQPEAVQFEVILSALHQPQNNGRVHNALSTLFFNYAYTTPEQLSQAQIQSINYHWLQLLQWAKLGEWLTVFDWLIDGSGTRLRAERDNDNRLLANLKKIANTLCDYALQHNANRAELLRFYKKLRLTAEEQDKDSQNQDTDQQAVKVMTMHAAKGLEFPVVFIFDGLTPPSKNKPYHKFYDSDHQATIYDVSKQSSSLQEMAFHNEFKQLYYVAMTRSIFKLFIPYINIKSKGISEDYKQLIIANIDACCGFLPVADEGRPANTEMASKPGPMIKLIKEAEPLYVKFSQSPARLSARSYFIHSFSSLSQKMVNSVITADEHRYGESNKTSDEPIKETQVVTEEPLIPGGVTTGHVLHGIFEHVNFEQVISHHDLSSLWADILIMGVVDAQMQLFKLKNQLISQPNNERTSALDYRQQMAAWVWHTLRKPLKMLDDKSLGMISAANRRHEMSFHWRHQEQQLTGYIDLLFRIKNQQGGDDYFILDWKSNINAAGYSPEILKETVMQQHHYDLQYHIYAAAVDQWFHHLALPNARLKGALYMFSRGINCESNEQDGIFYHEFSDLNQQNNNTKQQIVELTTGLKS